MALRFSVEIEISEPLARQRIVLSYGARNEAPIMEQELVCDDRLDVARRLYRALCAQYPDRFIALFYVDGPSSQLAAVGRKRPL